MAHFYGKVQGQRGEATRLGGKKSGLTTTAASWEGAVQTRLYDEKGVIMVSIDLVPWKGQGKSREIFRGSLDDLSRAPFIHGPVCTPPDESK